METRWNGFKIQKTICFHLILFSLKNSGYDYNVHIQVLDDVYQKPEIFLSHKTRRNKMSPELLSLYQGLKYRNWYQYRPIDVEAQYTLPNTIYLQSTYLNINNVFSALDGFLHLWGFKKILHLWEFKIK